MRKSRLDLVLNFCSMHPTFFSYLSYKRLLKNPLDSLGASYLDGGLGTCWVCYFDPDKCSKVLDLPEDLRPMAIIPIGYPASDSIPEKKRKSMDEIVKFL